MQEKEILKDATILVVDDNPTNLNVLSDCLAVAGFTVLLKKDGEKALALLQRKMPDLILLDIIMPGIDGFETCRRIKANEATKDVPVIFMTALSETVDKLKGFEMGAVDYITKPFHHEEVLARVRAHLMIQRLKKDLEIKNKKLQESLERERKLMEDLRLNLSISLPHELRTPLNAILGFSEFLIDPKNLPQAYEIAEYAKSIREGGLRLHRLVENALLYANLKLLKYAPKTGNIFQSEISIDAKTFIIPLAKKIASDAGRLKDLEIDIVDANIHVSPKNLEKILIELLENVFKFSLPETPVRIQTSVNGSLYVISIIDQGRGMTNEQISNIGAYMQFDRKRYEQQGSGLGLTIAYLLMQLEGGMLSIDSKLNQGTTVNIVFNRQLYPSNHVKAPSLQWFTSKKHSRKITGYKFLSCFPFEKYLKIMIMTTSDENRIFLKEVLSCADIEIIEALNVHDGLNKAMENMPDIVFTDADILSEIVEYDMIGQIQQTRISGNMKFIAFSDIPNGCETAPDTRTVLYDDILSAPVDIQIVLDKLAAHMGLDWIYEHGKEDKPPVMPSEDILKELYQMAVKGSIGDIFDSLDHIEKMSPLYEQFVRKIRGFADAFQINMIRQFIGKYLKNEDHKTE